VPHTLNPSRVPPAKRVRPHAAQTTRLRWASAHLEHSGVPSAKRRCTPSVIPHALAALLGGVRSEAGRADPTPLSAVRQSRGVPAARGAAWAGDPSSTRTEFVKQLHHDRRGGVVTTGERVRVV